METVDYKFGRIESGSREIPHVYSHTWAQEPVGDRTRLVIAPKEQHIAVLKDLTLMMEEPFGILYVLVVPRTAHEAGRYQSPKPISRKELLAFLSRFEAFLQNDGRHHLWISSVEKPEFVVYDRHNVIYAYGQADRFKWVLEARAMQEAPEIKIPSPHAHYYNARFDADERELLGSSKWKHFPLRESDDD